MLIQRIEICQDLGLKVLGIKENKDMLLNFQYLINFVYF